MRRTLLVGLTAMLSACMTLPRYNVAEPKYSGQRSSQILSRPVVIYFEPVFIGKRFDEVVCDNVVGAIWNPEESIKIGFTQNYAEALPKILPLMALEATLPYNIGRGRVASGESSLNFNNLKIDSRILVPFGLYVARNTEDLLLSASRQSKVCFDVTCVDEQRNHPGINAVTTVRFSKFRVSEDTPNKLTLVVEGNAMLDEQGRKREVPIKYEIVDRSITSEGYTHNSFLKAMEKMANELSSNVADQILAASQ